MAKKGYRRKKRFTIPLGIYAPLGYTVARRGYELAGGVPIDTILDRTLYEYSGYSFEFKNWKFDRMKLGAIPLVAGLMAHKVAGKLGLNRMLANAGIPYIRI